MSKGPVCPHLDSPDSLVVLTVAHHEVLFRESREELVEGLEAQADAGSQPHGATQIVRIGLEICPRGLHSDHLWCGVSDEPLWSNRSLDALRLEVRLR